MNNSPPPIWIVGRGSKCKNNGILSGIYSMIKFKFCKCFSLNFVCCSFDQIVFLLRQFEWDVENSNSIHDGNYTHGETYCYTKQKVTRIVGLSSNKNSTPPFNYHVSQDSAFCRLIYHACEKTTSMTHPDISYSIIYIITSKIPRGNVYRIFKEHYIRHVRGPPFNYQGGGVFLK